MELSAQQKTLLTRAISAVVAVVIVLALFLIFRIGGLKFLVFFSVVAGSLELSKILMDLDFKNEKLWIVLGSILVTFVGAIVWTKHSLLPLALSTTLVVIYSLLRTNQFRSLDEMQGFVVKTALSSIYLGTFPAFVYYLLSMPHGEGLFFGLLAIVFSGDICAYLVGSKWGQRKLLPQVSPKKTIEGALGGLVGSVLAALVVSLIMNFHSVFQFIMAGILVGATAQAGDLFESLIKRVANQKDSGSIMPGHGGILDRLDGVIFAAPIFYFFFV